MTTTTVRLLALAVLLCSALALTASPSTAAGTAVVTSAADAGPGTFRQAILDANADAGITTVTVAEPLEIALQSAVVYTGPQPLTILGHDSTLSGASVAPDTLTWDSGLLVATGGGNLAVEDLVLADSFNNGLAVFVPAGLAGPVSVTLDRVTVTGAQFHGVLVDGQSTSGYNTDDIIHEQCTDPHAVDAGVPVEVAVDRTSVTGSGQIEGVDITLASGCPQDFDGLRVDQGGTGDLTASITRSSFDGNLADGIELDETGDGDVDATVDRVTFEGNGATEPITCTDEAQCGDDVGEQIVDLDDGFDIDETGDGDIIAAIRRTTVDDNRDEGLDLDEAGDGSIIATVAQTSAAANGDEAYKATEEDGGDNELAMSRVSFVGNGNDGAEIEEADHGDVTATLDRATITASQGTGVKVAQEDEGAGTLAITRSDLRGNEDGPYEADGVTTSVARSEI